MSVNKYDSSTGTLTPLAGLPLESPAFTGIPTAPTASAGTSSGQLATTAFVENEILSKADISSPAFIGTPTAPTASAATSSQQCCLCSN